MDERLLAILPPPRRPVWVPSDEQWKRFESKRFRVPTDFKEFVGVYGSGCINEFIEIYSPVEPNRFMNLGERANDAFVTLSDWPRKGIRLFPKAGGLLLFSNTTNGDMLFWRTQGDPDKWPIVVLHSRAPDTQEFDMPFSQWIYAILRREIVCQIFPDSFPGERSIYS